MFLKLFFKLRIKIVLGDFNTKVGRENIFKPMIRKEYLRQCIKDNGVRIVNFAKSKNLSIKSTIILHRHFHKHIWTSPDWKTNNQIDHILSERRWHSSIPDVRSFRGAECDTGGCKS